MKRCVICSQAILTDVQVIATQDGQLAHIACADREARAAWRRRTRLAGLQAIVSSVIMLVVVSVGQNIEEAIKLGLTLLVVHIAFHRRWWLLISQAMRRSIRRWYRGVQ